MICVLSACCVPDCSGHWRYSSKQAFLMELTVLSMVGKKIIRLKINLKIVINTGYIVNKYISKCE